MTFEQWIQKLKKSGDRATKGPWSHVQFDGCTVVGNGVICEPKNKCRDADFITLARNEWNTMISLLESYREALDNIDKTLQIPAAEYVPAISDVLKILDKTTSKKPWEGKK